MKLQMIRWLTCSVSLAVSTMHADTPPCGNTGSGGPAQPPPCNCPQSCPSGGVNCPNHRIVSTFD